MDQKDDLNGTAPRPERRSSGGRRRKSLAAAAVLVVGLAACGSDGLDDYSIMPEIVTTTFEQGEGVSEEIPTTTVPPLNEATATVHIIETNGIDYTIDLRVLRQRASVSISPKAVPGENTMTCDTQIRVEENLTNNLVDRPTPEVNWSFIGIYLPPPSGELPTGTPPNWDGIVESIWSDPDGTIWLTAGAQELGGATSDEGFSYSVNSVDCPPSVSDELGQRLKTALESGDIVYVFRSDLINGMGTGYSAYLRLEPDGTALAALPSTAQSFAFYGTPNQILNAAGDHIILDETG